MHCECLPFALVPHSTRLFSDYLTDFHKVRQFQSIGSIGCRYGFESSCAAADVPPSITPLTADRVFLREFFVFLQDKSSSNIFAKEFRKSNIPET